MQRITGYETVNPHLIWGFALKWGAGVERLAKVIWNLYRVSIDVRFYSSMMLDLSGVPASNYCYVCCPYHR